MEIILKQDMTNLGYKDEIVKVKDGYANNFLIPQGYAMVATASNKKIIAENNLSLGHAKAIMAAENPEEYAKQVIAGSMSVHEAEKSLKATKKVKDESDMEQEALAEQLSNLLKMSWMKYALYFRADLY